MVPLFYGSQCIIWYWLHYWESNGTIWERCGLRPIYDWVVFAPTAGSGP